MKSTHLRTKALRRAALALDRRRLFGMDHDIPEQKPVRNYYIKIFDRWYLMSCASRPDRGLRLQLEKRVAKEMQKEAARKARLDEEAARIRSESPLVHVPGRAPADPPIVTASEGAPVVGTAHPRTRNIAAAGLAALLALTAGAGSMPRKR